MAPSRNRDRRVRCPKCAAVLTEPQAQIYECPICSTYLLARGYGAGYTSDKRLLINGGQVKDTPESHAVSDSLNQSLEKPSLPRSAYSPSEVASEIRSEKSGEASPSHVSIRQSFDLDSDSHSELDSGSPLWSPENAKGSEVPRISSFLNGLEHSSIVHSSNEWKTTVTSSYFERHADEEDAGKDAKNGDKQQSMVQHEHCTEGVADSSEADCDKRQSLAQHELSTAPLYDNKEADDASITIVNDCESKSASETAEGEDSRNSVDYKEKAIMGKFQLFDLSVFGIQNEATYNELPHGRVVHYPSQAGNVDDIERPDGGEAGSKFPSFAPQGLSSNEDRPGAVSNKNMLPLDTIEDVMEIPVSDAGAIDAGTGDNDNMPVDSLQEVTGTSGLDSTLWEAENVGDGSLNDQKGLPVPHGDINALDEACYGDDLGLKGLSSESGAADISFDDWQSQPFSMSVDTMLKLDPYYEDEKRRINSALEEDTDSSWDDNEELTFSSTAEGSVHPEGTTLMDGAHSSPDVESANDESQAKIIIDKPFFPLRTTAMQKFLKRDEQQRASQTQSSETFINSDSLPYEAPYVEHYSPRLVDVTHKVSDQSLPPTPVQGDLNVSPMREHESRIETLELEHARSETDLQKQNVPDAQISPSLSTKQSNVFSASECQEEKRIQPPDTDHPVSRNSSETSLQDDGILWKAVSKGLNTADLAAQEVDFVNRLYPIRQENPAGAQASLKWKGKGSSIRSSSSTEDEGAYGMESDVGSGPEKDFFKAGSVASYSRPLLAKEQRAWVGTIEPNQRKLGGWEPAMSRRTARSRQSNERVSNQGHLMGEGRVPEEHKSFDSEPSEWTDFGKRGDQRTVYLGSTVSNLNTEARDQMPNHLSASNITADYSSDHSSYFQDIPSYSHAPENLPNFGSPASNSSARVHPLQLSHGSAAPSRQEGLSHQSHAHHGIYSACAICIQQQYLQHPHLHQDMMTHECAACSVQASAAHQPMHHEMHGQYMHGLTHSNHALRHRDSIVQSSESNTENMLRLQHSDLSKPGRKMKRHPPLPGEGAPPYVLCRNCHQVLQVPEYLPDISRFVQKVHCSACGKILKFSVPQADIQASWSSVISSGWDDCFEINKQHMDISRVYSSGQRPFSGVVSPAHNSFGKGRLVPDQGVQQAWTKDQANSHSIAYGNSLIQSDVAGHKNRIRPPVATTVSGQAAYGLRAVDRKHASIDTGPYNEDYGSSSPSSASGSSPRRLSQLNQDHEQALALVMGRPLRDHKFNLDLASHTSMHDQGRSPPEAASILQRDDSENQSKMSLTSSQGSALEPLGDSPRYADLERYDINAPRGSWHNEPEDRYHSGLISPKSQVEQAQQLVVAPGSPIVEDLSTRQRKPQESSAPRSPKIEYQASPRHPHSHSGSGGRSFEESHPRLPVQDSIKGPMSVTGLIKRSIKDLGKGGQRGGNRREVTVNGYLMSEAALRKAEEQAGPIHSGTYWYDNQAGFWGIVGGPCLGALMPFIEEFHFPLARDCASGKTGILINGRELHDQDLEVLAKRGLPTSPGKAYKLDISGALFDDPSGEYVKSLGKLAPSIEKRGRGYGMSPSMPTG